MTRGPDPEISTIDILEQFIVNPDPVFIASEIAEKLDVTEQGARHRLNKLSEDKLLRKKKPGSKTVMYWITEDGIDYYRENHTD